MWSLQGVCGASAFFVGRKVGEKSGRQRERISGRAGTPSGGYCWYTDRKDMVSNESRALVQMVGISAPLPERSYWLTGDMKLITFLPISWQKALSFVIRTKDISRRGGISYGFRLPDRELTDLDFFITRSTVHSKKDPATIKNFPQAPCLIS